MDSNATYDTVHYITTKRDSALKNSDFGIKFSNSGPVGANHSILPDSFADESGDDPFSIGNTGNIGNKTPGGTRYHIGEIYIHTSYLTFITKSAFPDIYIQIY